MVGGVDFQDPGKGFLLGKDFFSVDNSINITGQGNAGRRVMGRNREAASESSQIDKIVRILPRGADREHRTFLAGFWIASKPGIESSIVRDADCIDV